MPFIRGSFIHSDEIITTSNERSVVTTRVSVVYTEGPEVHYFIYSDACSEQCSFPKVMDFVVSSFFLKLS